MVVVSSVVCRLLCVVCWLLFSGLLLFVVWCRCVRFVVCCVMCVVNCCVLRNLRYRALCVARCVPFVVR